MLRLMREKLVTGVPSVAWMAPWPNVQSGTTVGLPRKFQWKWVVDYHP